MFFSKKRDFFSIYCVFTALHTVFDKESRGMASALFVFGNVIVPTPLFYTEFRSYFFFFFGSGSSGYIASKSSFRNSSDMSSSFTLSISEAPA